MTYALPGNIPTHVVKEQHWVHRNELRTGMNVLELDVPWEQTNFMFQGFVIDSRQLLEQIQSECEYALVQTEKLAMINSRSPGRLCGIAGARRAPILGREMFDLKAV